jgi:phenylacetate-CoA ligase
MIWNEKYETMPREDLETLQLRRLQDLVERVYYRVKPYREKMDNGGIKPSHIKSLADLQKLPFTTKDFLRDNYPFGLFTLPLEQVVRVHASSGTTGKPTVVGYTKRDIETWAEVMARSLACGGVQRGDIVQNAYGYGLFTGGLGAHYGAEKLGATVIPISGGQTKRQIMIMQDFRSTVLLSTPSYALNIAETMEDMGVDATNFALRVGIFGAEPWSENMREEVEKKLGLKAIDIYGLSEIIGPGVSMECIEAQHGMHIFEDHFMPEIIDPDTGQVLPPGEKGELVFTTRLITEPCVCGRSFLRMEKITGRTDDMLIIRGVNVFPTQVEHVLMGIEGVEPHYQIIVNREGTMDTMEVQVEVSEQLFSDEVKNLEKLSRRIQAEIKDLIGSTCKVTLVEPKTIQRSEGKAKRVIDNRKL